MKASEKLLCDHSLKITYISSRALRPTAALLLILIAVIFLLCSLRIIYSSNSCSQTSPTRTRIQYHQAQPPSSGLSHVSPLQNRTTLHHVVFGIAASSKLWKKRKNYIKLWWRPSEMRGVVWLDKPVKNDTVDGHLLPPVKISSDTSRFSYTYPKGRRSALRISRIVSETLRLGMKDVRWFVMGDDDTLFIPENLVRVLSKYDHNQFYYIGSSSESHTQNIHFSYNMAYGGGGLAISYPLAKALEKMQDRCIQRYPGLYGSDDRLQACMAELGVPLTKEPGFHQFDVFGDLTGLLGAHPIAPLVSLHHLDTVKPIFPNMDRVTALERLKVPAKLDPDGLMQQSICYKNRTWTVSVSWGYAVQIYRGLISAREMEMPTRTFISWYKRSDQMGFPFNTRPVSKNPCEKPFVYYLSNASYDKHMNKTFSEYVRAQGPHPECKSEIPNPSQITRVEVYKKPDLDIWNKAPRRNCCRVLPTSKNGTMVIDVGVCNEGEIVEFRR